jgi:drug/metabolite transporter (DMT)-like permease
MSTSPLSLAVAEHSPTRERLRGIASMAAAVFTFSIMDATLKRLSSHYGPLQVSCMRCLSSVVWLVLVIGYRRSWSMLRAAQPLLHAGRAVLGIGMLASFVYAVNQMTLAQTYSLFLAAPLLMTALSVPLHGEYVTGRRWIAILIGLSGVLVILHPWSKGPIPLVPALAAAGAAICYSLSALTVRSLGRGNSIMSTVFWNLVLVGAGAGLLSIDSWRAIPGPDWPWLAGTGLAGALGQFWITDAFRRAPPAVVAPFEYTSILWAFAIDWIFWSATPSSSLLLGAGIVIATGIYVIWDERRSVDLPMNPASPPP